MGPGASCHTLHVTGRFRVLLQDSVVVARRCFATQDYAIWQTGQYFRKVLLLCTRKRIGSCVRAWTSSNRIATTHRAVLTRRTLCNMLACVPKQYLVGLDQVVLTDAEGQPRRERRKKTYSRKRKVSLIKSLGFYRHARHDSRAYIQLYIDCIYPSGRPEPNWYERAIAPLLRPAFVRVRLAFVLYHEIGHHIHAEQCPEHREKENVADMYMWRLMKHLLLRRCYLVIPAVLGMMILPSF